MNDNLLIAFILFGIIDLTFVGMTCYNVCKYLKQMVEHLATTRNLVSNIVDVYNKGDKK